MGFGALSGLLLKGAEWFAVYLHIWSHIHWYVLYSHNASLPFRGGGHIRPAQSA